MIREITNRKKQAALSIAAGLTSGLLLFSWPTAQVGAQAPNPHPGGGGTSASTANTFLTAGCGVFTLQGEQSDSSGQTYTSEGADESTICLIDGSTLTLTDSTIHKTGDTSSDEDSSFFGLNAAVLVGSESTLTLTGGTVTTNGSGTNGVFATGSGSSAELSDLVIVAEGDGAHGVMATLGGILNLTDVDILTTGAHSGAIATDRGSGTITVSGGQVTTSGADSPAIYSTGVITVTGGTLVATGAESAVIEGANSITLTDSSLSSSMADKWGVMIYQSMSGDAEGTEGTFTMSGGTLANIAETGPLFFVTNSTANIHLTGVEVTAASGTLVQAGATERWGVSGANGGTVNLTAEAQTLAGDLVADSISSLNITLTNSASLAGAINADGAAQSAALTLDASSVWTVTADSILSTLSDADGIEGTNIVNIVGNGHTVYYDARLEANQALGGLTYTLVNGGELKPLN